MEISLWHFVLMGITVVAVIGGGIYAAGSVKSAEGYTLGGRSSGVAMVAGGIAGWAVMTFNSEPNTKVPSVSKA